MQGKTISDLIAAMKNGSTYVNVHTEQNPGGEVRGQLVDIP
jgi:CHRD domain